MDRDRLSQCFAALGMGTSQNDESRRRTFSCGALHAAVAASAACRAPQEKVLLLLSSFCEVPIPKAAKHCDKRSRSIANRLRLQGPYFLRASNRCSLRLKELLV